MNSNKDEFRASGRIQEDGLPVSVNCRIESIERIRTYPTAEPGDEDD